MPIESALARCNDRQERWYLPELLRIKGELMLREAPHSQAAQACFHEAMDLATQQGAHFWQLRSAISIAQFGIGRDQRAEALTLLEKVCGAMTEGSDIADMRIARSLIAQLRTASQ